MTYPQFPQQCIRLVEKLRQAVIRARKRAPLRVSRLAEGEGDAALLWRTLAMQSLDSPRRFRF